MSRSPFFYLEKYNPETDTYELVEPYVRDSKDDSHRTPADLFPFNGTHELFEIIERAKMSGIHRRLPPRVSEAISMELFEGIEDGETTPNERLDEEVRREKDVRWFTYADMEIFILKYPCYCADFSEEDPLHENPMIALKRRVDAFLEVCYPWGEWEDEKSFIRIVCWIW